MTENYLHLVWYFLQVEVWPWVWTSLANLATTAPTVPWCREQVMKVSTKFFRAVIW